jgi:hypothetical protein
MNRMFGEELKTRIKQLEEDLVQTQQNYVESVRAHKNYTTLRGIREKMREVKSELERLDPQLNWTPNDEQQRKEKF